MHNCAKADLHNDLLLWQKQNATQLFFSNDLLTCPNAKKICSFAKATNHCAGRRKSIGVLWYRLRGDIEGSLKRDRMSQVNAAHWSSFVLVKVMQSECTNAPKVLKWSVGRQ